MDKAVRTRCADYQCQQTMLISPDAVGKRTRCDACGLIFTARLEEIWAALHDKYQHVLSPASSTRSMERNGMDSGDFCNLECRKHGSLEQLGSRFSLCYTAGTDRQKPRAPYTDGLVAVLDDLRSKWNVGAIFRTAEGLGWGRLHLTGITPTPPDESIRRVALGAEDYFPWDYHSHVTEVIKSLKRQGYVPIALEQTADAVSLFDYLPPRNLALIVGNEVTGISPEALQLTQQRVYIPMTGRKASFNVAVAFAMATVMLRSNWDMHYRAGHLE